MDWGVCVAVALFLGSVTAAPYGGGYGPSGGSKHRLSYKEIIHIVPARSGESPGFQLDGDGNINRFIIPPNAFYSPETIQGPDGPILVMPARPGTTPGVVTNSDGSPQVVYVNQGPENGRPGGKHHLAYNVPIHITPAKKGQAGGVGLDNNGNIYKFIIPPDMFYSPGMIQGPDGPIMVMPTGPGTTPGVVTNNDGSPSVVYVQQGPENGRPGGKHHLAYNVAVQIVHAKKGQAGGVDLDSDGNIIKFIIPKEYFYYPGTIQGPDGPIMVMPAGRDTTTGVVTNSDGSPSVVYVPQGPENGRPGGKHHLAYNLAVQIVPAQNGESPGVQLDDDGNIIKFIIPPNLFYSPGTIQGPDGPIMVMPAGQGTTPGVVTNNDGSPSVVYVPQGSDNTEIHFVTDRPIQIVPEGPGTTPGFKVDGDNNVYQIVVPASSFTTPTTMQGPYGPIFVGPAGPGATPGVYFDSADHPIYIFLPRSPNPFQFVKTSTPKGNNQQYNFLFDRPIQIVPEGGGKTPGLFVDRNNNVYQIVVPAFAYNTPGVIPSPFGPIFVGPAPPGESPGLKFDDQGRLIFIYLPSSPSTFQYTRTTTTPTPVDPNINFQFDRPIRIVPEVPGKTPGFKVDNDNNVYKIVVPYSAFTTPTTIQGPFGPIFVGPAGPGTTPGIYFDSQGRPIYIFLPNSPSKFEFTRTRTTPSSPDTQIHFPIDKPIQIVPEEPGKPPGIKFDGNNNVYEIVIPTFAYKTPGTIQGPYGPIFVGPAPPGETPGLRFDDQDRLIIIYLSKQPTNFQSVKTSTTPKDDTQIHFQFDRPIRIVPEGPGSTPGFKVDKDNNVYEIVVPVSSFTTPTTIQGPYGPIFVGPAGQGTRPGLYFDNQNRPVYIFLPNSPSEVNFIRTTPKEDGHQVNFVFNRPIRIVPEGPGNPPGFRVDQDNNVYEIVVPLDAFTNPGTIQGPYGPIVIGPARPGTKPGVQFDSQNHPIFIFLPNTPGEFTFVRTSTTPRIDGKQLQFLFGRPIRIVPEGPGRTPGLKSNQDNVVYLIVIPISAYTTPGYILGPFGPIYVGPAPPGTQPGIRFDDKNHPVYIFLPNTPTDFEYVRPNDQTDRTARPDTMLLNFLFDRPIQISPEGPGKTPGFKTDRKNVVYEIVVPIGAYNTPGYIPGPEGPIYVGPAPPGSAPGVYFDGQNRPVYIFLPRTPITFQFVRIRPDNTTTPRPLQAIRIVIAGPGTTVGTITDDGGDIIEFIVPPGAFQTPGYIPGPKGVPIFVRPSGPDDTPGLKYYPDGTIEVLVLPFNLIPPQTTPTEQATYHGKVIYIIPAGPGTTPGTITDGEGDPVQFYVPPSAYGQPGTIPGYVPGRNIDTEPAGPGAEPGIRTGPDGYIYKLVLPTTRAPPQPIRVVIAGPGQSPGTSQDDQGNVIEIVVPEGAFQTPGYIPGPQGVQIYVKPAGPGENPGVRFNPDGTIKVVVLPYRPAQQGGGTITVNGKIIYVIPAGPGTTPGTVTDGEGNAVQFIVPPSAYGTPGTIPGPNGRVIKTEPVGPGGMTGVKIGRDGFIHKLILPTTRPPYNGPPIIIEVAGPGTTPGTVTDEHGNPIKFVVPYSAFISGGYIPGPNGVLIRVEPGKPGSSPGVEFNGDGTIKVLILSDRPPKPRPSTPIKIRVAGQGTNPGTVTDSDGNVTEFVVPYSAFSSGGYIPGPNGALIRVQPAGPGQSPGVQYNADGSIKVLILPNTPPRTPRPPGPPIKITVAGDGTTPGTITDANGNPIEFVVPYSAFQYGGYIPGPNGVQIRVVPSGPGMTPGVQYNDDGSIKMLILPPAPKRRPSKAIKISIAQYGKTPGTVTDSDGNPIEFIVPEGAFQTPGYILGPNGSPVRVEPAGPGTSPGVKFNSDGSIKVIYLPMRS